MVFDSLPQSVNRWLSLDDDSLSALLAARGEDINNFLVLESFNDGEFTETNLLPTSAGWLALHVSDSQELCVQPVSDPVKKQPQYSPSIFSEPRLVEHEGWVTYEFTGLPSAGLWCRIMRHPFKEKFALILHDQHENTQHLIASEIYPEVVLCGTLSPYVVIVEPHPHKPRMARACVFDLPMGSNRCSVKRVLIEGPAAGVKVEPCSLQRFIKLAAGARTERTWLIVDTSDLDAPFISPPDPIRDPALFDVALCDGKSLLVYAVNFEKTWQVFGSVICAGAELSWTLVSEGMGMVRQLLGCEDSLLLCIDSGIGDTPSQDIEMVRLDDFQRPATVKHVCSTSGIFRVPFNTVPSVGFSIVEHMPGGVRKYRYFDQTGREFNSFASQGESFVRSARDYFTSPDGFECSLEIRWRDGDADSFCGPMIFMVYGAYGLDIDLDMDQNLGYWFDQGYAVATANVRGGGEKRHHLGIRNLRDRSVADTIAAVQRLRSGSGVVMATKLCVVSASAGGFLAASLLTEDPAIVDAAIIVNGYVDPLESLLRHSSLTVQADRDEWGDPINNPDDLEMLTMLSPFRRLKTAPPPTLVILSVFDARVNPRQGFSWALRASELGGKVTLWYDPRGSHDQWGSQLHLKVLVDWVTNALGVGDGGQGK